ncbi:hypothetical protein LguiA_024460 [Lonicera macranthoides]
MIGESVVVVVVVVVVEEVRSLVQESADNQLVISSPRSLFGKLFKALFYFHLLLITILVIFLTVYGLVFAGKNRHFHPRKWYPPLLASTACAGIAGFACQCFTYYSPARTLKAAFYLSPLLTCAAGILLIAIGSAGSLVAGVVALILAVIQSLYACWVSPRFDYAARVLLVSVAFPPPKTGTICFLSILTSIVYSCFLVSGIGGATASGTTIYKLFIFIILLSLAWTMHIIKNTVQVTISRAKYMNFAGGTEINTMVVFNGTVKHSMGSVCFGSVLVPVLGVIRGSARAISSVSGDSDEFMFSCANCYSRVASTLITYGNRWGFVHVGVYNKGFVQSSVDTWEIFRRVRLEPLIDSDLTSSFCFLCGVGGGALCGLVGGSWALVVHKSYATEVSIYAWLIGYFVVRVAMAWPQASVSAYYVAYGENPESERFDSTIPARVQALQRLELRSQQE